MQKAIYHTCTTHTTKSTLPLEACALEHQSDPAYLPAVYAVAESPESDNASVAATWLLLRLYRADPSAAQRDVARLTALLKTTTHPDARLHLIQSLDRAVPALKDPARKKLATALRADATHKRPFIRAWTLSVLARLAANTKSIQPWVADLIEEAESTAPASVKARIRQLHKEHALDWLDD